MKRYSPYVMVDIFRDPERPSAIGFQFEAEDGTTLSSQQLLDALAEYLLMADPNIVFEANREGMN